jgi:hypothetical protein
LDYSLLAIDSHSAFANTYRAVVASAVLAAAASALARATAVAVVGEVDDGRLHDIEVD